MKRFIPFIAICLGLLAFSACDKESGDRLSDEELTKDVQFSFTTGKLTRTIEAKSSDGEESGLAWRIALLRDPSDIEGCIHLHAFTNGRMVDDSFFLSLYMKKAGLKKGAEPEFERTLLCLPLSSYSGDSSYSFSGHIYLKEYDGSSVTLRFDNAVFNNYILNGDLTFVAGELTDYFK